MAVIIRGAEWMSYMSTTMLSALSRVWKVENIKPSLMSLRNNGVMLNDGALLIKEINISREDLNIHHITLRALADRGLVVVRRENDIELVRLTEKGRAVIESIHKEFE